MKNLSTTQQYFLCILKKNGKISSLEMEKPPAWQLPPWWELLMEDVLAFDGEAVCSGTAARGEKLFAPGV